MSPDGYEKTPAGELFYALRSIEKDKNLTPYQSELINRSAEMINALDVLTYQCVIACKRMGFVYDEASKHNEFHEAFMWLQEKGSDAYAATMAVSQYEFLKGVESRLKDLVNFYEARNNNGQS